jgi:peptidoglycan hydrolase CwlO-like protein
MTTEQWHLDKRVPIALIVTLCLQTSAAIWWAASINERMAVNEATITAVKADQVSAGKELEAQRTQVAVLVEQLGNTNKNLERLQTEVRDTNVLLREMITKSARP